MKNKIILFLALAVVVMFFISACQPAAGKTPTGKAVSAAKAIPKKTAPATENKEAVAPAKESAETSVKEQAAVPSGKNVVKMTSAGFSPRIVKIKVGETVTFLNADSQLHWPASVPHTHHNTYPGSNLAKCGTPEENNIFDACQGIEPGKAYTFKFDKGGEWGYHDHLAPGLVGSVVVEDR